MNKLSTQSYKGARDFYPQDMQVQNYIYEVWEKVCKKYGFEQYSFPILEPFEIFAAKTGEEIVNEQLFSFEDKGGRKLAIRPELTPGTVRMLAARYKELVSPVRWFMIGNNWRFESPQKGRGREFYQLEVNIFGEKSVLADFEIFQIIIEIMKEFGADQKMFTLLYSDRKLISALLKDELGLSEETAEDVRRMMDKRKKISLEDFSSSLSDLGLTSEQTNKVEAFMYSDLEGMKNVISAEVLENNQGYKNLLLLTKILGQNDLLKFCKFDPSIIRGFDYSDGLVYEAFDNNPKNNRSMFGGERFDELIKIFDDRMELAATGFAMGDWTLREFLSAWNLLPDFADNVEYLVTVWPTENAELKLKFFEASNKVWQNLINKEISAVKWLDFNTDLSKQLKYADKMGIKKVVIIGPDEFEKDVLVVKDMISGEQKSISFNEFFESLTS